MRGETLADGLEGAARLLGVIPGRTQRQLLQGKGSPVMQCATLLNAAAALYVSGNGWTFEQSVARSRQALKSGAAAAVLARVRAAAARS